MILAKVISTVLILRFHKNKCQRKPTLVLELTESKGVAVILAGSLALGSGLIRNT